MSTISFKLEENMLNTLIPNAFIDDFLPNAIPAYSCIYIYALRSCAGGEVSLNTKDLAKTFKLLESDVVNAWEYWEDLGLVKIHRSAKEIKNIEFLPVPRAEKPAATVSEIDKVLDEQEPALLEAPLYSPKELELYKKSYDEINNLFAKAELILGKMLDASELSILYSFYDWLRLPTDLIIFLLEYCAQNDHRRLRYIESVAIDWSENGIKTVEAAAAHIDLYNKDYRQILRALGLGGRNPAPKEMEYMEKWFKEYNLPAQIILEACDKTVISTGKGQFAYADKILEGWFSLGVKTLEDVKKIESEFKSSKATKKEPVKSPRANRFANFKQRERNYDEVEKREAEFLIKYLENKSDS